MGGWEGDEGIVEEFGVYESTHFYYGNFACEFDIYCGGVEVNVFVHTMLKIPVPVSLTEVKQHEAWLVLR